jgi:DMSO reductase anchor subunit
MPAKKIFSTVQDWSLFILFAGYMAFSLGVLIYIFRFSRMPVFVSILFLLLASVLGVLFVFMIQRFG